MIKPAIYKVKQIEHGFLAIMARPVGGDWIDEEFLGISDFGIKRLVCLLEDDEIEELKLSRSEECCKQREIEYLHFPIQDRGLPHSFECFKAMIADLYDRIKKGDNTVIHCRAGIGRAGFMGASVLVKHGYSAEDAFRLVSQARKVPVPDTEAQYDWVVRFSELELG